MSECWEDKVEHLRETLTEDMVARWWRYRMGAELPNDTMEYDGIREEMITEAYNLGFDEWDDEFVDGYD